MICKRRRSCAFSSAGISGLFCAERECAYVCLPPSQQWTGELMAPAGSLAPEEGATDMEGGLALKADPVQRSSGCLHLHQPGEVRRATDTSACPMFHGSRTDMEAPTLA